MGRFSAQVSPLQSLDEQEEQTSAAEAVIDTPPYGTTEVVPCRVLFSLQSYPDSQALPYGSNPDSSNAIVTRMLNPAV